MLDAFIDLRKVVAALDNPIVAGQTLNIPEIRKETDKKQWTLLYGWDPLCSVCSKTAKRVNKALRLYNKENFQVIGLVSNLTDINTVKRIREWGSLAWDTDIMIDLGKQLRLSTAVPYFIIVDQNGKIHASLTGADKDFEDALKKTIKGK